MADLCDGRVACRKLPARPWQDVIDKGRTTMVRGRSGKWDHPESRGDMAHTIDNNAAP